jgi:hypothetical protein
MFLDSAVVQHLKAKAGDRGLSDPRQRALKPGVQTKTIERVVRKAIREELRRA